ncbi:Fe2+-dependent dioxygenase [Lusitaniella coriacea LEGE 07157]|uniref:Fe2+-dependent dioxygenase n=1 Tax=Lusitaniella coriacea LEGE 07157 TaxID=945747 RepID=A0A8J7E0W1_9CYAN|nr:Fe2+-dependent dioxygenase [Lusitaniella coriacea]MBE9118188.1 Fe2+-dependent dioxygenase [Lusitaniella coriacea LEGE 07157]
MIAIIDDVLAPEELQEILTHFDRADFVDGKKTAGWHAKLVKNNMQLPSKATSTQELRKQVKEALIRNKLFQALVQPKIVHSLLFSRYEVGMSYGTHVDNAFMGKGEFWRSDISFTLFLCEPEGYEGGELVIEASDGDRAYKLPSGSALVYPSSTLHRVNPVTAGVRFAAVGWVQSLVRDPDKREILFDLDTTRRSLFAKGGKTIEFDLISKSYANLLRQWAD